MSGHLRKETTKMKPDNSVQLDKNPPTLLQSLIKARTLETDMLWALRFEGSIFYEILKSLNSVN